MLFAGREVRIGKNCARGLEYGPRPQAEGRAQDQGHSFPNTDRPRLANNVFIFFSLENYFIRNVFVDCFTAAVSRRARAFDVVYEVSCLLNYLKEEIQFSLILN